MHREPTVCKHHLYSQRCKINSMAPTSLECTAQWDQPGWVGRVVGEVYGQRLSSNSCPKML